MKHFDFKILSFFIIGMGLLTGCETESGRGGLVPEEEVVTAEVARPEPTEETVNLPPVNESKEVRIGTVIDQYKGVPVYFNGKPLESQGRHKSPGGYNYGMKWQCVEFVKRYYYDRLKHPMPNTYGHAKDFFDRALEDGDFNEQRGLYQFINGGVFKPQADDIVVYAGDEYGHVAIITEVGEDYINIIQQNVGRATRHTIPFLIHKNHYYIMNKTIIGFLGRRAYEDRF